MTHVPLILVADDVPANVELLYDQLAMLGYRVISAVDGPSAVEMCFAEKPDLCILDVAMPAGSLRVDDRSTGFEVCRRLKRDPRTERIPVIFVTALNDTTDRVKAIEAGGDDFLTKPHNRQILSARVRSLLRLKFATDALDDSYRKLRELEKVRDDLMKMIVHDLKTPLTSVLASLEMALDGDFGAVSDMQRRVLGDAEAKAEDLLGLIGDLLEVARIEENAIDLDLTPIAPGAFVVEIVHEWEVRFQQEGAKVFVDVAEDAPVINADKGPAQARLRESHSERPDAHGKWRRDHDHGAQGYGDGRHSLHGSGQRAGNSARVSRADLPEVRAREAAGGAARAQLGAGARVLQARRGGARRADLGSEHRGERKSVPHRAAGASAGAAVGGGARGLVSFCPWPTPRPSTSKPTAAK